MNFIQPCQTPNLWGVFRIQGRIDVDWRVVVLNRAGSKIVEAFGETFLKLKWYPLACWTIIDYYVGWVTGDMVGDEYSMIARCSSIARAAKPRLHPVTVPAGNLHQLEQKNPRETGNMGPVEVFSHRRKPGPRCTLCFDGQQYQGPGGILGVTFRSLRRILWLSIGFIVDIYDICMFMYIFTAHLQNIRHFAKDVCRWLIQLPRKLVWIPQIRWPFKRGEESLYRLEISMLLGLQAGPNSQYFAVPLVLGQRKSPKMVWKSSELI